jgi:hypothetical protein
MLNNDILIVCILNNELNTTIIVLKPPVRQVNPGSSRPEAGTGPS